MSYVLDGYSDSSTLYVMRNAIRLNFYTPSSLIRGTLQLTTPPYRELQTGHF